MTRVCILLHSDYVWLGSAYAIHRTLGNLKDFCTFAKALPDPFTTYQDWPLAFWVACQAQMGFGYVPHNLCSYRLHGANHSGDPTCVAKVVRNFRRSLSTMNAISEIETCFDADARVRKVTQRELDFYGYLVDLYAGSKWRAAKIFFSNMPYLIGIPRLFRRRPSDFSGWTVLLVLLALAASRAKANG